MRVCRSPPAPFQMGFADRLKHGRMKIKRIFKRAQRINKGAPSGMLISLIVHAVAFFVAGLFVVFTVLPKSQPEFEPPLPVTRPKMKLKKPKVKVKKSSQPKPSSRIVAKLKTAKMPEIRISDLAGNGAGLLGDLGGGRRVCLGYIRY